MVDKKQDDKGKDPFSDSSEIFESIFKEATQEIQTETGKGVAQPGLKPKPKPEAKPKPEVKPKPETKPKAPTKLELEPKEEPAPKAEPPQEKPRSEQRPRLQPPTFKPRQEPIRRPITRTSGPDEEERGADLLSTHRLVRGGLQGQKPREERIGKVKKPKLPKKKGKGSPVLKIFLLLVLLAVGVGGASVYFGIVDLSDYIGLLEPAKKEAPKVAATKTPPPRPTAKPSQPAAPKPVQPVRPQAKPAASPNQPVQPPQAPPKAAEAVTASPPKAVTAPSARQEAAAAPGNVAAPPAPSAPTPLGARPQPPEVQAKPGPSSPPAVAKSETPSPPAQPPVKVEPPPAPAQPPVKSQPQAPPPVAQPPVKTETNASSTTVRPPAISKKVETPKSAPQPKGAVVAKTVPPLSGVGGSYPYSVYLGSFKNMDYLKRAMSIYESEGLLPYWTKVELGEKGTWYRVFTGHFRSAQEAETFIQQKRIKDGEVKETRYSNLVGIFGTRQAGEEKALALAKMGLSAYLIPAADGQVRLYSGAFVTKDGAEKNEADLISRGVRSEIVNR
jgi:hypothetical protein